MEKTRKLLIVVDMQNDFITGSLGTKEAQAIVPKVVEKIKSYDLANVFATRDTHQKDYASTQEGKKLPVEHCLKNTEGWLFPKEIEKALGDCKKFEKPAFASLALCDEIRRIHRHQPIEIELVGLCTDICVISNALLLKAFLPEVTISVDASCCAGVTPEKHEAALLTMESCQIKIER